ncbi:MAG TPA: DCC1-like thiol-disulfide oxidoreductase family protein [Myxococcaceae bacterium]|nr:DCC1-like thiol-disulfide oxidoreductase family protein [Myxococcaceae bacterium]
MNPPALLLWDGECGFCRRSVQWAERRDTTHAFQAVPYQQAPSPPMTPELRMACSRAVHLLTADGELLRAGRACLWVLQRVGHPVLARVLAVPPLVWAVEVGYWLVARNRQLASRFLFRRGAER